MGREEDLNRDVLEAVRRFQEETGIQRIYVFGSHAEGGASEGSDVDLLLVDPRFRGEKVFRRSRGLYRSWHVDLPVDFLCYTPEEFEDLRQRPTLVREAVDHGVAVA